jgi:hypothetical protein
MPTEPTNCTGRHGSQTPSLAIVGGCGHVGLPLGLVFAKKGVRVDLVDTCGERVAQVQKGRMPFQEEGADALPPRPGGRPANGTYFAQKEEVSWHASWW